MTRLDARQHEERAVVFDQVSDRVLNLLRDFGQPDSVLRDGDYTVDRDYIGYTEVIVFIGNLTLLRPTVVSKLQEVIKDFLGW